MIVKYIGLENTPTYDGWLKKETVYPVVSIFCETTGRILVRIIGIEKQIPAVFPLEEFQIIDNSIPKNWIVNFVAGKYIELCPKSWTEDGFWERFFDGDIEATDSFEREFKKAYDL